LAIGVGLPVVKELDNAQFVSNKPLKANTIGQIQASPGQEKKNAVPSGEVWQKCNSAVKYQHPAFESVILYEVVYE